MLDWWSDQREAILLPATTLPEITYLLGKRIGRDAEEAFVRAVASGEFTVEPLEEEDIARAGDLLGTYRDVPLGFVDASIVATAERLGITTLLTTDRRHFPIVRPRHLGAFRLAP